MSEHDPGEARLHALFAAAREYVVKVAADFRKNLETRLEEDETGRVDGGRAIADTLLQLLDGVVGAVSRGHEDISTHTDANPQQRPGPRKDDDR